MGELDFVIVGTPRSGTTLVQRLTCEISGVRVPLETHFLSLFALPLLRRRRFPLDRPALTEELDAFCALETAQPLALDRDAVISRLGGSCPSLAELFAAVVHVAAGPGAVVGEKTPSHLLWLPVLCRAFPRLRVVAVVRDPRGVVASNLDVPWGLSSPGLIAERWKHDQALVAAAADALGDRMTVVRYEDVVTDPASTRRRISELLGVAGSDTADATAMDRPPEPWKQRAMEPVDPGRADAWRTELSPRTAAAVLSVCEREAETLGYPVHEAAPNTWGLPPRDQLRRLRFRRDRAQTLAEIGRLAGRADVVGTAASQSA